MSKYPIPDKAHTRNALARTAAMSFAPLTRLTVGEALNWEVSR